MDSLYYLKRLPEIKDDLKESSVKILEALINNHQKPLSTKELVEICNISSRMIQYNLERLLNANPPLVRQAPNLRDLRNKRYTISPDLYEKVNSIKNSSQGGFNNFNMWIKLSK